MVAAVLSWVLARVEEVECGRGTGQGPAPPHVFARLRYTVWD